MAQGYIPGLAGNTSGGGVESVTGDSVDNTDPLNPIVNAPTSAPTDTTYALQGENWMPIYESVPTIRLMWSSDTVNPPGIDEISADSNDLSLVTVLKVNTTLSNGANLLFVLEKLSKGNSLYGVVDQNSDSFGGFTISGNTIDKGGYFEIPVTSRTSGLSPNDGDPLLLNVIATKGKANVLAVNSFPYVNATPLTGADFDTGLDPSTIDANSHIIFNALYTVNASGDQYNLSSRMMASLTVLQFDVKNPRTAEPEAGSGDVSTYVWHDSVTKTIWYHVDFDGSAKVLNQTSLSVVSYDVDYE